MLIAPDEAGHAALAHEIKPTADGEAGVVHLVEMQRCVFVLPEIVIVGVLVPFTQHGFVVLDVACHGAALDEALRLGGAADAVAFLIQAQARVGHILRHEMRRLGDGKIVLCVTRLGAAIGADLACAPRLGGEPFAHVIAITQRPPLQSAVATVNAFTFMRATVVHESDDKAAFSKLGGRLA